MKYIAIFDIPDGYGFGCATAKIAPNRRYELAEKRNAKLSKEVDTYLGVRE